MSSSDKASDAYRAAYVKTITDMVGFDASKNPQSAIFIAPIRTRGIPGGNDCPEAVTNQGIYALADPLLNPNNMNYVPDYSNSYTQKLLACLDYIKLNASPDSGDVSAWMYAKENADLATQGFYKTRAEAIKAFNDDPDDGKPNFQTWLSSNYPTYMNSWSQMQAACAKLDEATIRKDGQGATALNMYKNNLRQAINGLSPVSGMNMQCSAQDVNYLRALEKAALSGQPANLPQPQNISYMPLYAIQGYRSKVDQWVQGYNNAKETKYQITVDQGQDFTQDKTGFQNIGGGASFSNIPFFSFSADGSTTDSEVTKQIDQNRNDISIAITVKNKDVFPVVPGKWDISEGTLQGYTFKDLPSSFQTPLIRPTQILFASGIGLECTVSGSVQQTFDKTVEQTIKAGGRLRILGFDVGLGANYEKNKKEETHQFNYDKANGKFTIAPTNDSGISTILAILGSKVSLGKQ